VTGRRCALDLYAACHAVGTVVARLARLAWPALVFASTTAMAEPCMLDGPQGTRAWAECGVVEVAVAVDAPAPVLGIAYARLPATGASDRGAPIVLLAGGPGQAALRDFVPVLPHLDGVRARHDVVLVDVRGTGRSQPQRCPDDRPLASRLGGDGDDAILTACVGALTVPARHLLTADAARDVDAVRLALGIERWHVLGVSYGTRLALTYDRLFPGRAVTLTLDGFVPVDRALGDDVAADMTASLRALGDGAVDDFRAVKAHLAAAPHPVQLRHPTTGVVLQLTATAALVNGAVRMLLYATETRAVLPVLLHAARDGDLGPLVALAVLSGEQLEGALHGPVNASVLCAEDVPFFAAAVAAPGGVAAPAFDDERPGMRRQCARWATVPPSRPVFSGTKTPTLILSGEHDPITPPHHAERALLRFADVVHVVAPGQGHHVLARGCIPDVVADFVDRQTARGLAVACVRRLAPIAPFVDAQGPSP
jgi:pimeloyl-ACP methyl ester carboxylesterase